MFTKKYIFVIVCICITFSVCLLSCGNTGVIDNDSFEAGSDGSLENEGFSKNADPDGVVDGAVIKSDNDNNVSQVSVKDPSIEYKYKYKRYEPDYYDENGNVFYPDKTVDVQKPEELYSSVEYVFEGTVSDIRFEKNEGINWYDYDVYFKPDEKITYFTVIEVIPVKMYKGEKRDSFSVVIPFGYPGYYEDEQKAFTEKIDQPLYVMPLLGKQVKIGHEYIFSVNKLENKGEERFSWFGLRTYAFGKNPEKDYMISIKDSDTIVSYKNRGKKDSSFAQIENYPAVKDFYFTYDEYKAYIDSLG